MEGGNDKIKRYDVKNNKPIFGFEHRNSVGGGIAAEDEAAFHVSWGGVDETSFVAEDLEERRERGERRGKGEEGGGRGERRERRE